MRQKAGSMPRHIVILGAGISGLSCAWFLKKKWGSEVSLTILERSACVGGWIQTVEQDGFLFEQGPHSCRPQGQGMHTLQLIEELGLQKHVIPGDPSARMRYLYTQQKLHRLPSHLFSFLLSPFAKEILSALWHDWRTPKQERADETIYDFIARRLSPKLADQFVDPLVSGIYAGDIRKLSIKACFPLLYELEQEHGSLIKGLLKRKKTSVSTNLFSRSLQKLPVFSFKKGMSTLIHALESQLEGSIRLNCAPQALHVQREGVTLVLPNQEIMHADHLIVAVPARALGGLLESYDSDLARQLCSIPHASVMVVNLGYSLPVLKQKGFGYLIPSHENEPVLGCIWHSSVFPQQNRDPKETRLTVMLGGTHHPEIESLTEQEGLSLALESVNKQLNISIFPDAVRIKLAKQAIPQYEVGYQDFLSRLRSKIAAFSSHLTVIGHAFDGVSLNDCIAHAKKTAFFI